MTEPPNAPWEKLRELGGEEVTDREGESRIWISGLPKLPKPGEQSKKAECASKPGRRPGP
jgi:hypothetical protein